MWQKKFTASLIGCGNEIGNVCDSGGSLCYCNDDKWHYVV